jgi:hypothetical protein
LLRTSCEIRLITYRPGAGAAVWCQSPSHVPCFWSKHISVMMLTKAGGLYIFLALAGVHVVHGFSVSAAAGRPGSAWAVSQQRSFSRLDATSALCGKPARLPLKSGRITHRKSSIITTKLSADQREGDVSSQQSSIVDQVASKGMKIIICQISGKT